MPSQITAFLNPWKYRRQREAERLSAVRARDGENCARCRRPMRFDLPAGHDQGAKVEYVTASGGEALANLRLCHRRCFVPGVDHTDEVTERIRRKAEADLLSKPRRKSRKAA